jgi:biopolymer transport protein ExbD
MKRALLVLIIIVTTAVPLSQRGVDVGVPPAPGPLPAGRDPDIVLEYGADGLITVNSQPVTLLALRAFLTDAYRSRHDKTMWIAAAGSLRYGDVAEVIDLAKAAGVERVGVITPGMRAAAR